MNGTAITTQIRRVREDAIAAARQDALEAAFAARLLLMAPPAAPLQQVDSTLDMLADAGDKGCPGASQGYFAGLNGACIAFILGVFFTLLIQFVLQQMRVIWVPVIRRTRSRLPAAPAASIAAAGERSQDSSFATTPIVQGTPVEATRATTAIFSLPVGWPPTVLSTEDNMIFGERFSANGNINAFTREQRVQ